MFRVARIATIDAGTEPVLLFEGNSWRRSTGCLCVGNAFHKRWRYQPNPK